MSKWIRKGDKVVVIAGNDKGKIGEVLARSGERVIVQGVNIRKKHMKRRAKVGSGEIIEMEVPFHISNVMICDKEGKPVKLKVRVNSKGDKELFFLKEKEEVVHRTL